MGTRRINSQSGLAIAALVTSRLNEHATKEAMRSTAIWAQTECVYILAMFPVFLGSAWLVDRSSYNHLKQETNIHSF